MAEKIVVKVGRLADKSPLFPTTKPIVGARLQRFGIIEGGTESGKTAVAFFFELPDKELIVEVTAESFRGLAAELEKAEDLFAGRNDGKRISITADGLRKAWNQISHSDKKKSDIKFDKLAEILGL